MEQINRVRLCPDRYPEVSRGSPPPVARRLPTTGKDGCQRESGVINRLLGKWTVGYQVAGCEESQFTIHMTFDLFARTTSTVWALARIDFSGRVIQDSTVAGQFFLDQFERFRKGEHLLNVVNKKNKKLGY